MEVILNLFLYFIIYSIIGWILELAWKSIIEEKRFVKDTGFLNGPWCPIYGVGALMIIFLLKDYQSDTFGLFIVSMLLCVVLEYTTSYVMEKLFGQRWWDYSNYKYNLNGRICLLNTLAFGAAAVVLINQIHPFILNTVNLIPYKIHFSICIILLLIFLIDLFITLMSVFRLKEVFSKLNNTSKSKLVLRKNPKKLTEREFNKKSKLISINMKHILKKFPNLINNSQKEIKKALVQFLNTKKKNKK